MAAVLTLTTAGCATTVTAAQRRECRHLRGRMVARAIGVTLGAVVVLGGEDEHLGVVGQVVLAQVLG